MSQRYKFTVAYDGTGFSGFQTQPQKDTVQSVVEKALAQVLGETVKIIPSGRTDAGVHASAQVFHTTFKSTKAMGRIAKRDFLAKINGVLPNQIAVPKCEHAEGFHARKLARSKTYTYLIMISRIQNPFLEDKVWRMGVALNLMAMRRAAKSLIGCHDFSAFCAADSTAKSKIREILKIHFTTRSPAPFFTLPHEHFISIAFIGSGFLKQMVRNIVGTLVQVGLGKIAPTDVSQILESRDRKKAGMNAPARGLYLTKVVYD